MKDNVLYHKKFKRAEITIERTTLKEKVQGVVGIAVLALAIWYFTRQLWQRKWGDLLNRQNLVSRVCGIV